MKGNFNIDKNGFELVPFHTKMAHEDFAKEDKIFAAIYMPEVAGVMASSTKPEMAMRRLTRVLYYVCRFHNQ